MEPGTQASVSINHPEAIFSIIDFVSTQGTLLFICWMKRVLGPARKSAECGCKSSGRSFTLHLPLRSSKKLDRSESTNRSLPARINLLAW